MNLAAAVGVGINMGKPRLTRDLDAELIGSSVRLPRGMWRELDEITEESKKKDPEGVGLSRNEIIINLLRYAVDEARTAGAGEGEKPRPKSHK